MADTCRDPRAGRRPVWSSDRLHGDGPGSFHHHAAGRVRRDGPCRRRSWTFVWDKELGAKCGETWASRATTLSCAAAQRAASNLAADLKQSPLEQLVGREYTGDYVCNFTTKPGTPEALTNPDHASDVQLRHASGDSG